MNIKKHTYSPISMEIDSINGRSLYKMPYIKVETVYEFNDIKISVIDHKDEDGRKNHFSKIIGEIKDKKYEDVLTDILVNHNFPIKDGKIEICIQTDNQDDEEIHDTLYNNGFKRSDFEAQFGLLFEKLITEK